MKWHPYGGPGSGVWTIAGQHMLQVVPTDSGGGRWGWRWVVYRHSDSAGANGVAKGFDKSLERAKACAIAAAALEKQ